MPKACAAFGCLNVSICCLCPSCVASLCFFWDFHWHKNSKMKDGAASGSTETSAIRVESLSSITKWENFGSRCYLKHIAVITRSLLKGSSTRFLVSSRCALVAGGVCLSRPLRYNEDAARSCRLACDKQRTEPELHHLSSSFHLWWVSFQLLLPKNFKKRHYYSAECFFFFFFTMQVCVCVCV